LQNYRQCNLLKNFVFWIKEAILGHTLEDAISAVEMTNCVLDNYDGSHNF